MADNQLDSINSRYSQSRKKTKEKNTFLLFLNFFGGSELSIIIIMQTQLCVAAILHVPSPTFPPTSSFLMFLSRFLLFLLSLLLFSLKSCSSRMYLVRFRPDDFFIRSMRALSGDWVPRRTRPPAGRTTFMVASSSVNVRRVSALRQKTTVRKKKEKKKKKKRFRQDDDGGFRCRHSKIVL